MLTSFVLSWRHWFLCNKVMSKNPKSWWNLMKFLGKICQKTMLNVTKNQSFTLSLEDTSFEKSQGGRGWGQIDSPSPVGVMYVSYKVHKVNVDNFSLFWPILMALIISAYKLGKFLVLALKPLTANEFTIKMFFILLKKSLINNLISSWVAWM